MSVAGTTVVVNEVEIKPTSRHCICIFNVDTLSWIVRVVAIVEIVVNAVAAVLSVTAFFYNLINCNGTTGAGGASLSKSGADSSTICNLIESIISTLEFEVSSHIGAIIFTACLVHILVGLVLYDAALKRSIPKCQLAFFLATMQWLIGIVIFISAVESNHIAILIFLIFFTLKFLYLVLIRKYKHVLLKEPAAAAGHHEHCGGGT